MPCAEYRWFLNALHPTVVCSVGRSLFGQFNAKAIV